MKNGKFNEGIIKPNKEQLERTLSLTNDNEIYENFIRRKDSYDKDENILQKNKKKNLGEESLDLEQILNQSFEDSINPELFKSEVPKKIIRFSSYCSICNKFPIINTMFYCRDCDLNLCENCEKEIGLIHNHCYYKITNREQYEEILNIKIEEIKKNRNININNKKQNNYRNNGIFNSIIGIIMGK